jgi:hypothetical protein
MADASRDRELKLFDSMMLLSVLSTAADVGGAIDRRRAGQDPRAQEGSIYVRSYLSDAVDRLDKGFIGLFIQQVGRFEHEAVRHMDQLLLIRRLTRELHLVHQRLLSLYPRVSEEVIEEVRILERRCERLGARSPERFVEDLPSIVDEGLQTTGRLRRVVRSD